VCTGVEPLSVFNSPMGRPARTIPRAYRWDLRDAPPGPPMFSDKLDYPVQPTHLLQIDYETGPTSAQTFVIQTARDAGRWYVVAACPKPATVVEMEAAKKARAEQESKLSALVAGMSPELKRRVLDLLGQGQKIGAIRLYEREAGVDLTTAKGVVDRLAQEGR
jgi:ribosomal protein L7/L12